MDKFVTLSRALYAAAMVVTLFAAGVQLAPRFRLASPSQSAALPASAPTVTSAPDIDSKIVNAIAASNVFASDRSAPKRRYRSVTSSAAPVTPDSNANARPSRVIQLFGITITPTNAQALIEADPTIPGAEVYRVGDQVREYKLIELSDSAAVLDGPSGRQVLRLPSTSPSRSQRPQ